MHHRPIVRALELYHHDLMNDLQIIDGYVKMNSLINVQNHLEKWLDKVQLEQKLLSLNTPKFILFILQFNHHYKMMRLTYDINTEQKLTSIDETLYNKSQLILDQIENFPSLSDKITKLNITLKDYQQDEVALIYTIDCHELQKVDDVINKLQSIKHLDVAKIDEKIICTYTHQLLR